MTINQRIARNTLFLYLRMILIMAVNLYASRVVLRLLGATDVGIYAAVGSIVTMMSFASNALSAATSRFLTYALGTGKSVDVQRVFRVSVTVYGLFLILVLLLAETGGFWIVDTQLTIASDRMNAALVAYQMSIVTFVFSFLTIPFNSLIIAHERMDAFAYVSIFDALAKLGVLYLLPLLSIDRLPAYALLLAVVQCGLFAVYAVYCFCQFGETTLRPLWDRIIVRQLGSYASWSMFGYVAVMGSNQGLTVLLSHFFNPVVCAARIFALQVQSAVTQCAFNFQLAVRQQVIKTYAQGRHDDTRRLVLKSGRYAFLLVLILLVPLMAYTETVLQLWLGNPPEYLVVFTRITLLACLVGSLSQHTLMAIHATGDIRRFQVCEGLCLLATLPLAYLACRLWQCSPSMIYVIYLAVEVVAQAVRISIVYPKMNIPIHRFFTDILRPCLVSLAVAAFIIWGAYCLPQPQGVLPVAAAIILLCVLTTISVAVFGLEASERYMILQYIHRFLHRNKKGGELC